MYINAWRLSVRQKHAEYIDEANKICGVVSFSLRKESFLPRKFA